MPHGKTTIRGELLDTVNVSDANSERSATVIDCTGCLIIPGLINAHTHAPMSLLRGIADDLPLREWLHHYIFPSEARFVDREFVYLGAMLSAAEMALSGTTTFADGYFHMEQVAAAAREVGLRAVVAQGILDIPTPDAPEAGSWHLRAEEFLARSGPDPLSHSGIVLPFVVLVQSPHPADRQANGTRQRGSALLSRGRDGVGGR